MESWSDAELHDVVGAPDNPLRLAAVAEFERRRANDQATVAKAQIDAAEYAKKITRLTAISAAAAVISALAAVASFAFR